MNKKDKLTIMCVVLVIALLSFSYCYYRASKFTIKITDKYINNLDVEGSVEELVKGSGLTKNQYKAIITGMGVYANLRYVNLNISKIESEIEDKSKKTDKEFVDIFLSSLHNFVFKYKNGISKVINEDDQIFKYVKSFVLMFSTKEEYLTVDDNFTKYLTYYKASKKTAEDLYDKDIVKVLYDTKINIKEGDDIKEYSAADAVWGIYLTFFGQKARLLLPQ